MTLHVLNTDDPAALRFVNASDIRAFLVVYRAATRVLPWTGVGPAPVADPDTPHARVEAWLERLGES